MLFLCFLPFALAAAAACALLAPAVTLWGLLLAALLGFAGGNLLFVLFCLLLWLFLPRLGPDEGVERQNLFCRRVLEAACRYLCRWAGVRVEMSGLEKLPDTPFLLVSNHRTLFDPLSTVGWFSSRYNVSFISKPSNFEVPFIGRPARLAGYLAIDRENDRAALKTILRAADYLKRGVCSVGIYPEGTRNRTDAPLLPFHAGSFKIAQKAAAPLVILCVRGTDKVAKPLFFRRTPVYLDVLEVLDAETVKSMKTVELAEHARQLMEAKLREGDV